MESNFTVISNNLLCLSFYRVFRFYKKKKKIKICRANHSFLKTINSIKTRKPTIIGRTRFRVFFSFFFSKTGQILNIGKLRSHTQDNIRKICSFSCLFYHLYFVGDIYFRR